MKHPEYITLYLNGVPVHRISMRIVDTFPKDVRESAYRLAGLPAKPTPLDWLVIAHNNMAVQLADEAAEKWPRLRQHMTHAYEIYERRN